jgi:2-hydroxycyclohexanecarboxyl-CoA dehydrogenase
MVFAKWVLVHPSPAGSPSYSVAKAGVIMLTRALALYLAKDNIRVNCICPGLIYTPFWERGAEELWKSVPAYRSLKEPKEIFLRYVKKLVPLGREQQPEDIGYMVVFLASEEAKNITGQSINVDGGMVMQ